MVYNILIYVILGLISVTGLNEIPNEALSVIANRSNRCLRSAVFPSRWKRARLMLLRKGPDKPLDNSASNLCAYWTPRISS